MKKLFIKIHLWLSIPFGVIIAIVCLTGAILVFETEILELCYPSRYFVKKVSDTPLPPTGLMSAARRQLPDSIKINGLRVYADPHRAYQLVLPGKKAAGFINPYTGEITGMDNGQGFFLKTMRLHRWLLDEYKRDGSFSWGKTIVGVSTLILVLIIISGLIIWYPHNRKILHNRLKIKTRKGRHRFLYDLHVSGGFYAALLLLALSLTGLTWSFGWYRTAFYNVFGASTLQVKVQTSPPSIPDSETSFNEKESRKKREKQQTRVNYTQWAAVLTSLEKIYPNFNTITLQDGIAIVSTAKYGNTRGTDRYSFDPSTGQITETILYKDLPRSDKIRGWIYSVHIGSWGGIITRILSCLTALLGTIFAITGYYFWIKKRIKKRIKNKV